ncbi:MAG: transporter [Flavobacteriaceae bacterium]|nr:transporter [Flavobacteriaceae bacterium]
MKRSFLLFLLIGITQLALAQYTEIINSNRPGFSQSPFGVGQYVYQVEAGLFYRKTQIKNRFSTPRSFGETLSLRYGYFNEKFEFNLDLTYTKDKLAFRDIYTTYKNVSGLSQFTFGAKYLLYKPEYEDKTKEIRSWKKRTSFDEKRLVPSVGVYLGVNTPLVSDYFNYGISPKIAVYLQNNISPRYVVLTNFIADKLGTHEASYTYIITETYALNNKYSFFLENLGRYNVNLRNELQFAGGLAYLKSNNLQLDTSLRFVIEGESTGAYVSLGASWRFDKHAEYVKLKEEKKTKDRILTDKNRDKEALSRKKSMLQQLYRRSKKVHKTKRVKSSRKIKTPKRRRIKKLPRRKETKLKKKGFFKNIFKKKKKTKVKSDS